MVNDIKKKIPVNDQGSIKIMIITILNERVVVKLIVNIPLLIIRLIKQRSLW